MREKLIVAALALQKSKPQKPTMLLRTEVDGMLYERLRVTEGWVGDDGGRQQVLRGQKVNAGFAVAAIIEVRADRGVGLHQDVTDGAISAGGFPDRAGERLSGHQGACGGRWGGVEVAFVAAGHRRFRGLGISRGGYIFIRAPPV